MQRRPSPLLQDYKSRPAASNKKHGPLRWFIAGLGIPLLITAIFVSMDDELFRRYVPSAVRDARFRNSRGTRKP